ncbi:MAG: hypothetical protein JRH20_03635, partial [Deltaproteobacteria bacterium]|nr:hypothetical protein [Deltaproteobacteria bacterium]
AIAQRAVGVAVKLLQAPYDERFILANGSYYCSELVQEAFKRANAGEPVFKARPMFFGKPETSEREVWSRYYTTRGWKVPDGQPGVSPLGIYLDAKGLCDR